MISFITLLAFLLAGYGIVNGVREIKEDNQKPVYVPSLQSLLTKSKEAYDKFRYCMGHNRRIEDLWSERKRHRARQFYADWKAAEKEIEDYVTRHHHKDECIYCGYPGGLDMRVGQGIYEVRCYFYCPACKCKFAKFYPEEREYGDY